MSEPLPAKFICLEAWTTQPDSTSLRSMITLARSSAERYALVLSAMGVHLNTFRGDHAATLPAPQLRGNARGIGARRPSHLRTVRKAGRLHGASGRWPGSRLRDRSVNRRIGATGGVRWREVSAPAPRHQRRKLPGTRFERAFHGHNSTIDHDPEVVHGASCS